MLYNYNWQYLDFPPELNYTHTPALHTLHSTIETALCGDQCPPSETISSLQQKSKLKQSCNNLLK